MANWSERSVEFIPPLVRRLARVEDFVRVTCVCKSWRSVAIREKSNTHFGPWLMLTKFTDDDTNDKGIQDCYTVPNDRVFKLGLPQAQGRRCWGTPYGWLVTLGLDLDIHLLNPLTGSQISLPSIPSGSFPWNNLQALCSNCIAKFVLSSNPSDPRQSVVSMAIYGYSGELLFASPGDESWTRIGTSSQNADIIFFKGWFYCVSTQGMLRICDINKTVPEVEDIAYPPHPLKPCTYYLVEISGQLHMICRFYKSTEPDLFDGEHRRDTRSFEVFKLNFDTVEWIKVEDLDNHAVLIGNNTSFAVSTFKYSELKPNYIYFCDDGFAAHGTNFFDMGVYDYKRKVLDENFYQVNDLPSKFCRGVFWMPSF